MAKSSPVPLCVRAANVMTTTLARAGFKIVAYGRYPMYLLTVRGRKSGQPRTIPIVIVEQNGNRYLTSPYGQADWVRNLRAAGEATLTRGRRTERVSARELPIDEAARVLREDVIAGNPFASNYNVTAESPLEDFERATATHPVFVLERK